MFIIIVVLLVPLQSQAFLDFIGNQAKEAIEAAAYVDAVADLSSEISTDSDLKNASKELAKRADALRSEAYNVKSLSQSTKAVLNGPDWSSKRLETNIRNTTDYIRRMKRLVSKISALGLTGATALNGTETNVALNEVQKNQQTMILQNEDAKIRDLEKETEESKQWTEFSNNQKNLRKGEAVSGKF